MANMLISVNAIIAITSKFRPASGAATPVVTCDCTIDVTRNTKPQASPIQCRIPRLRLTTAPANCRLGRISRMKDRGRYHKREKQDSAHPNYQR